MTTSNDLYKEMDNVTIKLIELGLSIEQNFPSSKKSKNLTEISWSSRKDISIALKDVGYTAIYNEFNEQKNYNIKLIDGALIQMMYRIDNEEQLVEHRLAFLPSPHLKEYQNEPDSYEKDEIYGDIISRQVLPVPIRFDYDISPEKYKLITHPISHITIGEYKDCRIPIRSAVTPHLFMDFILRNFYLPHDNLLSTKEMKTFRRLEKSIYSDEEKVFHFNIN